MMDRGVYGGRREGDWKGVGRREDKSGDGLFGVNKNIQKVCRALRRAGSLRS